MEKMAIQPSYLIRHDVHMMSVQVIEFLCTTVLSAKSRVSSISIMHTVTGLMTSHNHLIRRPSLLW